MELDFELNIEYRDIPPWRSFHLNTYGETFQELYDNATISEIDQDGGELDCYGLERGDNITEAATKAIDNYIFKRQESWLKNG